MDINGEKRHLNVDKKHCCIGAYRTTKQRVLWALERFILETAFLYIGLLYTNNQPAIFIKDFHWLVVFNQITFNIFRLRLKH